MPVQPAGAMTIIEKLRAAKSMMPGNVGNIMSMVLQQGPGSLLQNPIGAPSTVMQGQLGGMMGALGNPRRHGAPGADGRAQRGRGAAAGAGLAHRPHEQPLGLTGGGLMQLVGHANTLSMFGNMVPPGIGLDIVTKPLMMAGSLSGMVSGLQHIESAVIGGAMGEADAVARVTGMTAEITGVVQAAETALATVENAAINIAQSAAALSMIASGPPALAPIINMIVRDEHKAEIQEAMDEQIRA